MSISEMHAKTMQEARERISHAEGLLFGALVDAKQPYLQKLGTPNGLSREEMGEIAFSTSRKFIRELAILKQTELIANLANPNSEESNQVIAFLEKHDEPRDLVEGVWYAVRVMARKFVTNPESLTSALRQ